MIITASDKPTAVMAILMIHLVKLFELVKATLFAMKLDVFTSGNNTLF